MDLNDTKPLHVSPELLQTVMVGSEVPADKTNMNTRLNNAFTPERKKGL